ncbi:MAG: hypothetical protein JO102_01110 [Elusimicrobia bacterium]|nr:hypothetical protein [Elusimicrobiota bacterium]
MELGAGEAPFRLTHFAILPVDPSRRHAIDPVRRLALSLLIAGLIVLQASATFGRLTRRYWPVLTYPMYTEPHYAGDAVPFYSIAGIEADGHETEIRADAVDLSLWKFMTGPVAQIKSGDAAGLRPFVEHAEARLGRRFTALRLTQIDCRLTGSGVVREPHIVGTVEVAR